MLSSKICTKCKESKLLSEFYSDKKKSDGLKSNCKACIANSMAIKYQNDREKIINNAKKYYANNKESILSSEDKKRYREEYRESNREKIKEQSKIYNKENHEKIKNYNSEARKKRREAGIKYNHPKNAMYAKKWREKNKDKTSTYEKSRVGMRVIYRRTRKKNDSLYCSIISIRDSIRNAISRKGYLKTSRTYEILGCSYEQFMLFIESKFTDGMSWSNKSEWHLDHVIPLSTAKTEDDVILLNHFTNFQPLWAVDNLKKGCKYPYNS
jgi:urease gamma subunit